MLYNVTLINFDVNFSSLWMCDVMLFQCHETRSLQTNRQVARRRMQERLDWHYNGSDALAEKLKRQLSAERRNRKEGTKQRLAKLLAFKQREGIE